jgi:DNA-binding MarR family transcriptional regulator
MTGQGEPNRVAQLLQRAHLAAHHQRAASARQLGLPLVDITALEHLVVLGPLRPGQLGPRLDLTSGGVTTLLRRLAGVGYIVDCPEPRDRRLRPRRATPAGVLRVADFLTPTWRADSAALASLTPEEAGLLEDLLGLLVQRREQAAAHTPPPHTGPSIDGEHVKALVM